MRKILAGFLATSMIVAVASSVTFAESIAQAVTISDVTLSGAPTVDNTNLDENDTFTGAPDKYTESVKLGTINVLVTYNSAKIYEEDIPNTLKASTTGTLAAADGDTSTTDAEVTVVAPTTAAKITAKDISSVIAKGTKAFNVRIGGNLYGFTFGLNSAGNLVLNSNASTMPAGVNVAITYPGVDVAVSPETIAASTNSATLTAASATVATTDGITTIADGETYAEVEKSGVLDSAAVDISDAVICDGSGNPIVYTEKLSSAGEDRNGDDGVQSGKTLYFMLNDKGAIPKLADDTYWKLKVTKGDNGKYIKAITDVSKSFSKGLYPINGTDRDPDTVGRHRFIKVELNEIFTDDEYKLTLDMRISAKSKAVNAKLKVNGAEVTDDSEIKVKDFSFYMKNLVKDADNDWKVGISGLMLNPLENDWNDVTYYDEDGDLAHVKFFADSDTSKFYAKLSTKWEHADYASYFNDQDAYIFDFTGSPKLSSTSRADLEIYNPFVDEDGNETVEPSSATIYQVIDGDLFDVTSSFEYKEGDNGDMAYVTRTRFLGTYIICEKPVEEAVDKSETPDELVPDTDTTPSEVTPDNNGGGKAPANTGKYL